MIPGILIISRVNMKVQPIEDASNNNMGILIVAQAPTNSRMFENLLPLPIKTAATGNAAYSGPAEKAPKKRERNMPVRPEFSPISLMIVSLGTHTAILI